MKIATWNVNSIRAREERALAWVEANQPDVLCLQELKVEDALFPRDAFEALGYHCAIHGQKTYNGVAILSRSAADELATGIAIDDPQARCIAATVQGVRVVNVYVPNGQEVGSSKWSYKLHWLDAFANWIESHYDRDDDLVVCGDFNIAPTDRDAARPERWTDSVLCHPDARKKLQRIESWGLVDLHPRVEEEPAFTWWDYRRLAFPKNDGLRIDLILGTDRVVSRALSVIVDRDERKGTKPSDHAPVTLTLK